MGVAENYFSYFSTKTYVVGTQKNHLNEMVLLGTANICLNCKTYVVGTQKNRLNDMILLSSTNICLDCWLRK